MAEDKINYKRHEDAVLRDAIDYIGTTYSQHYVGDNGIQAIDVWDSLGTLSTTSRDTAIKYLLRYGKKKGKNKADLLKAIHYITLMISKFEEEQKNDATHKQS